MFIRKILPSVRRSKQTHNINFAPKYAVLFYLPMPVSVHYTDLYFPTCYRPRCTVWSSINLNVLFITLLLHETNKNKHIGCFIIRPCDQPASWSNGQSFWLLIVRSRVRFPVLPRGFFVEGEDPHGDHGLGSLVEFRFKAPPGTSYSYITNHLIGTT
jgi:hypothetical protein